MQFNLHQLSDPKSRRSSPSGPAPAVDCYAVPISNHTIIQHQDVWYPLQSERGIEWETVNSHNEITLQRRGKQPSSTAARLAVVARRLAASKFRQQLATVVVE